MSFKLGLDAGHGLNTPGKRTPDGIREWTLNDKVCNHIENLLKPYNVIIKRLDDRSGKIDKPLLSGRLRDAVNANVNALISVHHNAGGSSATGVEVLINPSPTSESLRLAQAINERLSSYTGLRNRGIKNQVSFTMVSRKNFPTVLTEGGFMDGKSDTKIIRTDKYQKAYAKAIVDSLIDIYNLKKISDPSKTKVYAKTTANVNLRKGPSTKDLILELIPKSTKVLINSFNNEWYKVTYTKQKKTYIGYCSSKYLDIL